MLTWNIWNAWFCILVVHQMFVLGTSISKADLLCVNDHRAQRRSAVFGPSWICGLWTGLGSLRILLGSKKGLKTDVSRLCIYFGTVLFKCPCHFWIRHVSLTSFLCSATCVNSTDLTLSLFYDSISQRKALKLWPLSFIQMAITFTILSYHTFQSSQALLLLIYKSKKYIKYK